MKSTLTIWGKQAVREAARADLLVDRLFVYEKLEQIPVVDDECAWRGFRIKVIEVESRTRMRVMIWKEQENS